MAALFLFLFVGLPLALTVLRITGLPMLVLALAWLAFLVVFAPINYFFGPFIIFGP